MDSLVTCSAEHTRNSNLITLGEESDCVPSRLKAHAKPRLATRAQCCKSIHNARRDVNRIDAKPR
jgi:hypothetical protein